jgi:hypothetical protein
MKKRILLFPGFGEDTFCFNELIPLLEQHPYKLIHVDYRPILDKFIFPVISVLQFSRQLIKHYGIQKEDKLIGHSMGGYFSFQIREIIESEICMIGAFHDTKKVIHIFPQFPRITMFAALTGLVKTKLLKNYLLNKINDKKYKSIQSLIMDNFDNFTNNELALMIEMNYQNKINSTLPNPLRIHDKNDRIIAPPDEAYIQVEGGHFCLNIQPQETYLAMKNFLK